MIYGWRLFEGKIASVLEREKFTCSRSVDYFKLLVTCTQAHANTPETHSGIQEIRSSALPLCFHPSHSKIHRNILEKKCTCSIDQPCSRWESPGCLTASALFAGLLCAGKTELWVTYDDESVLDYFEIFGKSMGIRVAVQRWKFIRRLIGSLSHFRYLNWKHIFSLPVNRVPLSRGILSGTRSNIEDAESRRAW